eukprot:scaffold125362_cov56-Attheya_sp.AAC.2
MAFENEEAVSADEEAAVVLGVDDGDDEEDDDETLKLTLSQAMYVNPKVRARSLFVLRLGVMADAVNTTILQPNYPIMATPNAHPPLAMAYMGDVFTDKDEKTMAIGMVGAYNMVGKVERWNQLCMRVYP